MRRFGFFIGVFSVGLVIFLIFTGQFAKLFEPQATSFDDPFPSPRTTTEKNLIRIPFHDVEKGRLLFSFVGEIQDQRTFRLDMNFTQAWSLRNAELEIPIYDAANDSSTPVNRFVLKANSVRYEPDQSRVHMLEVRGDTNDGSSLRTPELTLTWDDAGAIHLATEHEARLSYPSLELYGMKGLRGEVEPDLGRQVLVIHPPVFVVLSRGGGGHVLGLTIDPADGSNDRALIRSDGPLTIRRLKGRPGEATFERQVVIQRLEPGEDPRNAAEKPVPRCVAETLRVTIDANNPRILRATAERKELPVRFFLKDGLRIEGNRLEWFETGEALLEGDVVVVDTEGTVHASRARLFPHENRCQLEDQVRGEWRVAVLAESAEPGPPPPTGITETWELEADTVDIRYETTGGTRESKTSGSGTPESKTLDSGPIVSFQATSREPNGVVIREARDDGVRMYGSNLTYDRESARVRLTPSLSQPGARPFFMQNRNHISANVVTLDRQRAELVFQGAVASRIDDLAGIPGVKGTLWRKRGADFTDIRSDQLRLRWDRDSRQLNEIEAIGGEEPLALRDMAQSSQSTIHRLEGNRFRWHRTSGEFVLDGEGRQSLAAGDTELRARDIRCQTTEWLARARGDVTVTTRRAALLGTDVDGAQRIVSIHGDTLEVKLTPDEASDGASGPESAEIEWVRASALPDGVVRAEDGEFTVESGELFWEAPAGRMTLEGPRRQVLRYRAAGAAEEDTIGARKMSIFRDDRRVVLEGDVSASIWQHSLALNTSPASSAPQTPTDAAMRWELEAPGRVEIDFLPDVIRGNGVSGGFVIDRAQVRDGISLTNSTKQLFLQGNACDWDRALQRFRLYSADNLGMQSLSRGSGKLREEILAREIRVLRVAGGSERIAHLNILFHEKVNATFHARRPGPVTASTSALPSEFGFSCDDLLLVLEPEGKGAEGLDAREALAWGTVIFQGGRYRVFSDRAWYQRRTESLAFQALEGNRVQIFEQGKSPRSASQILLKRARSGDGYVVETRGGDPWRVEELKEVLELMQGEHKPK